MNRLLGQFIETEIKAFLQDFGFKRNALDFSRDAGACFEHIGFLHGKRAKGPLWFSYGVRVRYPDVNLLTALGEPETELRGTVGAPVHLLHAPFKYYEWNLHADSDIRALGKEVVISLKEHALPFLEKYSVLAAVQASLESPDPRDWFGLGPEGHLLTLAAIYWAQGYRDRAVKLLADSLEERVNDAPKARIRLSELLEYFQKLSLSLPAEPK